MSNLGSVRFFPSFHFFYFPLNISFSILQWLETVAVPKPFSYKRLASTVRNLIYSDITFQELLLTANKLQEICEKSQYAFLKKVLDCIRAPPKKLLVFSFLVTRINPFSEPKKGSNIDMTYLPKILVQQWKRKLSLIWQNFES